MFNFLPWLLDGSERSEYALIKQSFTSKSSNKLILFQDFDVTILYLLLLIIVTRVIFNSLFRGPSCQLALKYGKTASHRDGAKLLEECWVLFGNIGMITMASYIMFYRDMGGCWFGHIAPCLEQWPNHNVDAAVNLYYALELAWYFHLLLKPVFKYGLPDGRDMMIHHCASLVLLIAGCGLNLSRMGLIVLTLFGISNPVLHLAKIVNQLNFEQFRVPAFALFAFTFFVTRVLLVPILILVPGIYYSRQWLPYAVEDFHTAYVVLNLLLVVLYVMQLVWMSAIMRVLKHAKENGADAASSLSAQVDPAKRYQR